MQQPVFAMASFDSLQYHFFGDEACFSVRLQRCPSVEHSSAWLHDGVTRELVNSTERVLQSSASYLDVTTSKLSLSVPEGTGHVEVRDPRGKPVLEIDFEPRTEIVWDFPSGDANRVDQPVIHQPDLACRIRYDGRETDGIGYCKRAYLEPPRYMGYVFIHGVSADHKTKLWTADAGWGTAKYDYFKLLHPDGRLEEADSTDSYHQWDAAYATLGGRRVSVKIEELGRWQTSLVSGRMDSLYGQRYCTLQVDDGEQSFHGQALKEYWIGTVG